MPSNEGRQKQSIAIDNREEGKKGGRKERREGGKRKERKVGDKC